MALAFPLALLAQSPGHVEAGASRLQKGDAEGAIKELKAALADDPQNPAAHLLLGQAYLAQRSVSTIAEAKGELQQALALDPKLLWAHFYLAKVYLDFGLNEKAKDELEQGLALRADVPHFLSLLGEVERKLGNRERAIELNRKALALDPSMTPAHYYIALAYLDERKDDAAANELESALKSPYVVPEIYVALATLYVKSSRLNEAESLCKKAVALDPTRAETYVALARIYNAKGSADPALAAARLALPEGRSFPATAYYQQLQADAYFELGRAYQAKRMTREAIDAYGRALDLDPGREDARAAIEKLRSAGGGRLVQ